MFTYSEFHRLWRSYYRTALDYFNEKIKNDNEDIVLVNIDFKINEVIILYENVETSRYYTINIKIKDFVEYHKEKLNENCN